MAGVETKPTGFHSIAAYHLIFGLIYVRLTGLEPARRETPDPKSGASTNSATGASLGIENWNTLPSPIPFQVQRYTFLGICYHLIP